MSLPSQRVLRSRILEDLKGLHVRDLEFGAFDRNSYATDGSIQQVEPLGVIAPRSIRDLKSVVQYAREHRITLHPRGGGTNRLGSAIGPGFVLDMSRHFRRLQIIEGDTVEVQPGLVVNELNEALLPRGKCLWTDLPRLWSRTVGGVLCTAQISRFRNLESPIDDPLVAADVLLSDGSEIRLSTTTVDPTLVGSSSEQSAERLASRVRRFIRADQHQEQPRWERELVDQQRVHLHRLLLGTLGTMGILTRVKLRLRDQPRAIRSLLIPFRRLYDAAAAVSDCSLEGVSRCELIDGRTLLLAREYGRLWTDSIPKDAGGALFVDFQGEDHRVLSARSRALLQRLRKSRSLSFPTPEFTRKQDTEALWNLTRFTEARLMSVQGCRKPVDLYPLLFGSAKVWPELVDELLAIGRRHNLDWSIQGSLTTHEITARPFLDLNDPEDRSLAEVLQEELRTLNNRAELRTELAHGHVSELDFAEREKARQTRYQALKGLLDPSELVNPGINPWNIVEHPNGTIRSSGLDSKIPVESRHLPVISTRILNNVEELVQNSTHCNGCGDCKTLDPIFRICPSFRSSRSENESPRSKANFVRQIATGAIPPELWGSEAGRRAADSCIHCRLCAQECPSGVDVSTLMVEAKAAYVATHGLSPREWFLARIDTWSRLVARFPFLWNSVRRQGRARWLLEKVTGLSRHRVLPSVQYRTFLSRAESLGLSVPRPDRKGPRVLYFLDTVANAFDPMVAESTVAVLRHCGISVYVPTRQRGSGMAYLSVGDIEGARELAKHNIRILGNAVRDGYTIVCSEPTAALMLRDDYLRLTDDLDAELVSANTMDLGQYLLGLRDRGLLPTPRMAINARVGYHLPCHLRALEIGMPGFELLRSIPDLSLEHIDRGCSGMAGVFGLSKTNFRTSLRMGKGLRSRLRGSDLDLGASECSACRMQMAQGISKQSLHPITLLAAGFALLPQSGTTLKEPIGRRDLFGH